MNINKMKNCGKLFDFNVITNTGDGRYAENKIKLYEAMSPPCLQAE